MCASRGMPILFLLCEWLFPSHASSLWWLLAEFAEELPRQKVKDWVIPGISNDFVHLSLVNAMCSHLADAPPIGSLDQPHRWLC